MDSSIENVKGLISSAKKILVVSHAAPDPDAVACVLFTHKMLETNFKDKEIYSNIESANFDSFKSLFDASFITTLGFKEAFSTVKPDLLLVLDLSSLSVLSRGPVEKTEELVRSVKAVIIDHHIDKVSEKVAHTINLLDSSCVETLYKVFVREMGLKTYPGYQNHVLFGIVGDTGGFRYLEKYGVDTFDVVTELLKDGGNIDTVVNSLGRLNINEVSVQREMLANLKVNGDFTYTYVSDIFFRNNPQITDVEYSNANKIFVQYYLKSIGDSFWGFTFKPLKSGGYTMSFRCQMNTINVRVFAKQFNGGGHDSSAGGFIDAKSDIEARDAILEVIQKHRAEAYGNSGN